MWTEHTEYEEYHKLQLSTELRYQQNNTLWKISAEVGRALWADPTNQ